MMRAVRYDVLFVDDDTQLLGAMARVFEDAPFLGHAYFAATPDEALRALARHPIGVIVADQRMPEMSGIDLLKQVRSAYPDVVRLLATGAVNTDELIEAINHGQVYHFITKPWRNDELRLIVRRALEHYEVTQELRRRSRELSAAYAQLEGAHREQVRLYEMVICDDKTGVKNYHFFDVRLGEEFERARRHDHPLSLLMIDIDDFKLLNDSHGHVVGDIVLREVAQHLADGRRGIDVVARYGGEEFALILPETPLAGASIIAERVRERIAQARFAAMDLALTISIGVATYPRPELESRQDLVEAADQALYRAKRSGKNRLVQYGV